MRVITPIRFTGSADSSRRATPEPGSRTNSTDLVHFGTDVEGQLKISSDTAKDLFTRGVITEQDYQLLSAGPNRAHLTMRALKAHNRQLDKKVDDLWDDLNETEEELERVQKEAQKHLEAYVKTVHDLKQYQLQNAVLIQENVRLNHKLEKLSPTKTQEKPQVQSNFSKKISTTPEKTPFHKRPLHQQVLTRNQKLAEQKAKETEDSGSQ